MSKYSKHSSVSLEPRRRGCAPVFNGVDVYATYIKTVNIVCSKLYSSMDYL